MSKYMKEGVLEVLFDGTRATGVRVADESGNISTIASKVVVDASGQAAMVTSRLGLREWDPVLKKQPCGVTERSGPWNWS